MTEQETKQPVITQEVIDVIKKSSDEELYIKMKNLMNKKQDKHERLYIDEIINEMYRRRHDRPTD